MIIWCVCLLQKKLAAFFKGPLLRGSIEGNYTETLIIPVWLISICHFSLTHTHTYPAPLVTKPLVKLRSKCLEEPASHQINEGEDEITRCLLLQNEGLDQAVTICQESRDSAKVDFVCDVCVCMCEQVISDVGSNCIWYSSRKKYAVIIIAV